MALLFDEPHTVQLKRAAVARDADSNVATRDYVSAPALDVAISGMFQSRVGDLQQDDEGNVVTSDAILYTSRQDVKEDDQIVVALPGTADKFFVTGVDAKYDLDGEFTHNEVDLELERKR